MPELPEVESFCQQLSTVFCGQSIKSVKRLSQSLDMRKPLRGLVGIKFVAFVRHGKFVTVKLSDKTRLLIHLGMSGRLVVRPFHVRPRYAIPPEAQKGSWQLNST